MSHTSGVSNDPIRFHPDMERLEDGEAEEVEDERHPGPPAVPLVQPEDPCRDDEREDQQPERQPGEIVAALRNDRECHSDPGAESVIAGPGPR